MVETGGGGAIAILIVLALLALGCAFIVTALRDEDRGSDADPTFMARANHPLRHVQVAINADRKKARDKARQGSPETAGEAGDTAPKPQPPPPRRRPNWLRRVS